MAYQKAKAAKIEERLAHRACVGLVAHVMQVEDTAEIPRGALAEDELRVKISQEQEMRERKGKKGQKREDGSERRREGGRKKRKKE